MIELPLFWPPQLVVTLENLWLCKKPERVAVGGSKTFVFLGADPNGKMAGAPGSEPYRLSLLGNGFLDRSCSFIEMLF